MRYTSSSCRFISRSASSRALCGLPGRLCDRSTSISESCRTSQTDLIISWISGRDKEGISGGRAWKKKAYLSAGRGSIYADDTAMCRPLATKFFDRLPDASANFCFLRWDLSSCPAFRDLGWNTLSFLFFFLFGVLAAAFGAEGAMEEITRQKFSTATTEGQGECVIPGAIATTQLVFLSISGVLLSPTTERSAWL